MEAFAVISLLLVATAFIVSERRTRVILTSLALIIVAGCFVFIFAFRGLGAALGSTAGVDRALLCTFLYGVFLLALGATAVKLAK